MKSPTSNLSKPLFRRSVLSTVIALTAISASAQEATQDTNLEEVVVTAQFQRNLENALDVKRNASTIVDGISADDIGTLPALDMGEALQAVAGVQLNREGERRESSINLRGLPSGFVLTTAAGQTFANPTRSNAAFGAPNPLGAYDPAVFNGIDVIKTQTAAMQEGGIAGTVNQKLARALDKKEGVSVSVGLRSEQLADAMDKEFVISGSKQLIENTLAITGTLATSDQTFRRDTIKINRYDNLPTNSNFVGADGEDYATWAAANNLPENAVVKMPGELRQASEISSGRRTSFSGGVEFQPTEELKLGLNAVYTSRDMDEGAQQELDVRPRQSGVKVTPLIAPFDTGAINNDGNPIYNVSDIATTNSSVTNTSRHYGTLEESKAIILDAEWTNDDWTFDGAATFSSATNELNQIILAPRNDRLASGDNGVTGILRTGQGNIANFESQIDDILDLNQPYQVRETVTSSGSVAQLDNSRAFTLIIGEWEEATRDISSFEANALKIVEKGMLESIQFGARISSEAQSSARLRNSPAGIDVNGIITNDSRIDPAYVSESEFFGGKAPGFTRAGDGWYALDVPALAPQLAATIGDVGNGANNEAPVRVPYSNFIARGGQQQEGLTYEADLDTTALYAMANLAIGPVTGNAGLRYVTSSQEARAPFYDYTVDDLDLSNPEIANVKSDYSYVLPSVNLAWDINEDLILRAAYGESISRPNLRAAKPISSIRETNAGEGLEIILPGADVNPFSAQSYDLSLEWYNREGSAVTLAVFQKNIKDFFQTESFCDGAKLAEYGIDVGDIVTSGDNCIIEGAGPMGVDIQVDSSQLVNTDAEIDVQGFELSIQQNLNFLPAPWDGLGGVINYSSTSQDSPLEARIPGISDDTYNVIAYYEKGPFGIRFAYNYRTEYELESVGTFNGEGNKNVKAAGRVDMSAYYNVTDDLSLSFKGYNLTESLYEEYQDTERQPRANHFDGRVFVMQAKYTF